jgi:hypothetical protein
MLTGLNKMTNNTAVSTGWRKNCGLFKNSGENESLKGFE